MMRHENAHLNELVPGLWFLESNNSVIIIIWSQFHELNKYLGLVTENYTIEFVVTVKPLI